MKIFRLINKSFEVFLIALVAFQAVLLMASVLFRYLFSSPIVWGDEVIRYSLVWMTFVGAAMATKENQHIQVDVIDLLLSGRGRKILTVFVDVIVVSFMAFLCYYGVIMTDFQQGMFGETLAWFSYVYVYVSIPIGALGMIAYTVSKYVVKQEQEPVQG